VTQIHGREQSPAERLEFLQALHAMLARGDVTIGQALRVLRAGFLRMDREKFAKVVGVSRRELAKLETDRANSTVATLDRVFRPFGFRVGLLPMPRSAVSLSADAIPDARYREWLDAVRAAVARHSRSKG
jgi:transcriptional regulator with XRE-family HTH domain